MAEDYIVTALAAGDRIRIAAARTTEIVAQAQRRHGCSPTVSAALGRLLTGAALLGTSLGGRQRITLRVVGDGPVRGLIAEAASQGRVRGYPLRPAATMPLNERGKFDVGGLVGRGSLHVTRTFETGLPYTSAVPLASGEIGEDLATYFASSEQIPTVVAVGVLADREGIAAAGGILAQLMPGADEHLATRLETAARALPQISGLVRDGLSPEDLVDRLAGAMAPRITGASPISFSCHCDRTRVVRALLGLGRDALVEMAAARDGAEATCDFCGRRYQFSPDDIGAILEAGAQRRALV
jgi:molecular chaperone Hsp33